MSDTTIPPPNDPTLTIVGEPADGPFPDERLTMRFGFDGIPLTDDETARCLKARRDLGGGIVARLQIACAATPKPLTEGLRLAYPIRARHHIELSYAGRRVHIEAIAQELGGPGGTNDEVRVYVDGVLQGRSIRLGRLGGTVNTFPVVARIDEKTVMTATPVRWTSFEELVVELWSMRLPPRDQGGASLVDDDVRGERR